MNSTFLLRFLYGLYISMYQLHLVNIKTVHLELIVDLYWESEVWILWQNYIIMVLCFNSSVEWQYTLKEEKNKEGGEGGRGREAGKDEGKRVMKINTKTWSNCFVRTLAWFTLTEGYETEIAYLHFRNDSLEYGSSLWLSWDLWMAVLRTQPKSLNY